MFLFFLFLTHSLARASPVAQLLLHGIHHQRNSKSITPSTAERFPEQHLKIDPHIIKSRKKNTHTHSSSSTQQPGKTILQYIKNSSCGHARSSSEDEAVETGPPAASSLPPPPPPPLDSDSFLDRQGEGATTRPHTSARVSQSLPDDPPIDFEEERKLLKRSFLNSLYLASRLLACLSKHCSINAVPTYVVHTRHDPHRKHHHQPLLLIFPPVEKQNKSARRRDVRGGPHTVIGPHTDRTQADPVVPFPSNSRKLHLVGPVWVVMIRRSSSSTIQPHYGRSHDGRRPR